MIREPAVAGMFYPADPQKLREEVRGFLRPAEPLTPMPALGVVSPHAGYMYSGQVAGAVLSRVKIPDTVLMLCPNHTGLGAFASINSQGSWRTPLGDVPIAAALARRLKELDPLLQEDTLAHSREHALEVQLPFLQEINPDLQIIPLCLSHFSFEECKYLGQALAQWIGESEEEILMLASSDMNHYESQARTLAKDQRAIDCILKMDPELLYRTVHEEAISMCGIIPVTCMLIASLQLGGKRAQLVQHATSGDVSGDYSGVVGYAGIIIQ